MSFIFALLLSPSAQAGWFSRWCERHLVTDDPFQFESTSIDWIRREVDRLEIKSQWRKLDDKDLRYWALLVNELERRNAR